MGTFTAISSIVLLNLYIALLSDTFQRVHDNVQANALMQKVIAVNQYQSSLGRKKRDKFWRYIQGLCAPEKVGWVGSDIYCPYVCVCVVDVWGMQIPKPYQP